MLFHGRSTSSAPFFLTMRGTRVKESAMIRRLTMAIVLIPAFFSCSQLLLFSLVQTLP